MDVQNLLPEYYRQTFRELLSERASREPPSARSDRPTLFADVFTHTRAGSIIPAPQDLGESKHHAVDEDLTEPEGPSPFPVRQSEEKGTSPQAESAYKYIIAGTYAGPRFDTRKRMESLVRRAKKSGIACPHRTPEGLCAAPFIRCGDRIQFALRETRTQMGKPHACAYQPGAGGFVMIVDRDASMREFCKNTLEIFLGISPGRTYQAASCAEALDRFNRFKIEGKVCSLAVVDLEMPGQSGFELIDELFERNYSVDIVALKSRAGRIRKPAHFSGDIEIVPHRPMLRHVLTKPFHSEALVEAAREILGSAAAV